MYTYIGLTDCLLCSVKGYFIFRTHLFAIVWGRTLWTVV